MSIVLQNMFQVAFCHFHIDVNQTVDFFLVDGLLEIPGNVDLCHGGIHGAGCLAYDADKIILMNQLDQAADMVNAAGIKGCDLGLAHGWLQRAAVQGAIYPRICGVDRFTCDELQGARWCNGMATCVFFRLESKV